MNRGFRIIFSKVRSACVVCHELTKQHGKKGGKSICAAAVLGVAVLSSSPSLAETWGQSTSIANETKVVTDGVISIADPGDPSAKINVNILNGGILYIADESHNASITGRVDITGTGKLFASEGKIVNNLTVGALVLESGAVVEVANNLIGEATKPYYVNVLTGSSLSVGGTLEGNFSAVTNDNRLSVGSINLDSGGFTTDSSAETTVTGDGISAQTITNHGLINFTGESATVKATKADSAIQGLGNWKSSGNLTFETRIDNGVSGNDCSATALIDVAGALTINSELNNAGQVKANRIDGDGNINNFNGKNKADDPVKIEATTIDIHGTFVNGQPNHPDYKSIVEADTITAGKYEQNSGSTKAQSITAVGELKVNAGEVSARKLSAKTFSTGISAVVSFTELDIQPDDPKTDQTHAGWLKSGNQNFTYNAKFQLQGTGKLTNQADEALDSVTINGVSVFSKGAVVKTKAYAAQGLNNTTDLNIGSVTLTAGEFGSGYLWNTNGAQSKFESLTAASISNGPNDASQSSTLIQVQNLIVSGKASNHTNGTSIGKLIVGNSAQIGRLNNAGVTEFANATVEIGEVQRGDDKSKGNAGDGSVAGEIKFTNSQASIENSSMLGDVKLVSSSLILGSGDYEINTLTSEVSTLNITHVDGTQVKAQTKSGEMTLAAPGVENDKYASAQQATEALAKVFTASDGNKADILLVKEGIVNDASLSTLNEDGTYTTTYTKNTNIDGLGSINALGLMQWRHEMNDLTKRLGELRDSPQGVGAWARLYGSEQQYGVQSVTAKSTSIQVGADLDVGSGWKVGAAFVYTDGDAKYSAGDADYDSYGLALYGTWLGQNGLFVDLIGKYSRLDSDFNAGALTGGYDNNAYSLSAEVGWHFKINDVFFVEPQAEFTWGHVTGDKFSAGSGVTVDQADYDSLIGRIGLRTGFYFPDNKGTIYARVSGLYDFDGETNASVVRGEATNSIDDDLGGAWVEFGVGANFNWTENTYTYVDLEKNAGGEVKENWRFNVGVRHVF